MIKLHIIENIEKWATHIALLEDNSIVNTQEISELLNSSDISLLALIEKWLRFGFRASCKI